MGPKRDIVGELKAFRPWKRRGMTLRVSSHRMEHWFFMSNGKSLGAICPNPDRDDLYWPSMPDPENFDAIDGKPSAEKFMEDWLVRTCELIDNYHPKILYFDWWIQQEAAKPYLKKQRRTIIIALRNGARRLPSITNSTRTCSARRCRILSARQMADIKPYFWQTDTAIALNSWCYTENNDYARRGHHLRPCGHRQQKRCAAF